MKITSKGQVTIPAEIRQQLNLHEGDEVDFVVEGSSVRIVRTDEGLTRGQRMVKRLQNSARLTMSTDELMELLRG
ncbi:AbrB/MazE/SpoVT family DNA-binding domain-containing protein [Sphaerisporangium perillae]|uniref:AbrB/MazE/SpoVT family DNA-binding domain-containing protein n=1 Tax=Sphaerisporangium perillae TaxID=2935860 RepID=UPI00200E5E14|nr:AbrB/MazE/SpoVT family DNA-binding domain-containing protein [Sphaerisporangium perillae]